MGGMALHLEELRSLIGYHYWATHRLLAPADLDRPIPAGPFNPGSGSFCSTW